MNNTSVICKNCGKVVDKYENERFQLCENCSNKRKVDRTYEGIYKNPKSKERFQNSLERLLPIVVESDLKQHLFDPKKINEALKKETGLESDKSKELIIAVSRYLIGNNIKIITSPMIREVVNSFCIKYDLETTRLKHTRVGIPKWDLDNIYKENGNKDYIQETFYLIGYLKTDLMTSNPDKKSILFKLQNISEMLYRWYESSDKKILDHIKKENKNIDNLIKVLEDEKNDKEL